jgi:hypothetical protein
VPAWKDEHPLVSCDGVAATPPSRLGVSYFAAVAGQAQMTRHWGCSRRMRRGAIEWTFIGWNEMRA